MTPNFARPLGKGPGAHPARAARAPRQVRLLLLAEDRWAAFWAVAAASALRDRFAFAHLPGAAGRDMADRVGLDWESGGRGVALLRRDGSHVTKAGLQSRKALTRFLLKNQWELVPQVCAGAACAGVRGLHVRGRVPV